MVPRVSLPVELVVPAMSNPLVTMKWLAFIRFCHFMSKCQLKYFSIIPQKSLDMIRFEVRIVNMDKTLLRGSWLLTKKSLNGFSRRCTVRCW